MRWQRIVHIIVTIILIGFLIWYYLPENKLVRSVDVCGYYSGKTNQTCTCFPVGKANAVTTIFYPNYSYKKIYPLQEYFLP